MLRQLPKWDGCEILREVVYDRQGHFNVQSVVDRYLAKPGPIVLVENVKTPDRLQLVEKLGARTVIQLCSASDSTSLWEAMETAHDAYQSGQPHTSQSAVLALLLMYKLEREFMWGGNAKGYKWASLLPTGRGIPDGYSHAMPRIIGLLYSHDVLIKKTSQGKNKYALNPELRPQIYEALRDRSLKGFPGLHRIFQRDGDLLSVRLLDIINVSLAATESQPIGL